MDSHLNFIHQLLQEMKRLKNNILLVAVLCLLSLNGRGSDSLLLRFSDYMHMVMNFHPTAKQAALLNEQSEFQLREARGNFDPQLSADYLNKYYGSKNYYSLFSSMLSVPVWFGPELKMGFDQNQGLFVNDEHATPQDGLWYAGIKVPLAQGILIDQRRAEVKKAKVFVQLNEQQQRLMLLDLFYSAAQRYFDWYLMHKNVEVHQNAVELASRRLNLIRELHRVGEKPGVDTLEATIQLQSRQLDLNESKMMLRNQALLLSVFLWNDAGDPVDLKEGILPDNLNETFDLIKADTTTFSLDQHPALLFYDYKLQQLEIDRRLKQDKLKPKLSAQYNFLSYSSPDVPLISPNNYKWGIQFSFPLFLRQERGAIGQAKLKIQQTEYDRDLKQQELNAKIKSAFNEMNFALQQMALALENMRNYNALLDAEKEKFIRGESSLFMINSREIKVIESQLKYYNTVYKYHKSKAAYRFALGKGFDQ